MRADRLDELAINTYFIANEKDTISAHIMFDYNEILDMANIGMGKEAVLEKWSGFDYEVTYQIYPKVGNSGIVNYVPYIGSDIVIHTIGDESVVSSEAGDGSLKVIYNVTKDQIENGNGDVPVEGVMSLPIQIVQNTKTMTTDLHSLTNYKIVAILKIVERGTLTETAKGTEDFFIYTVTKLKLDL